MAVRPSGSKKAKMCTPSVKAIMRRCLLLLAGLGLQIGVAVMKTRQSLAAEDECYATEAPSGPTICD